MATVTPKKPTAKAAVGGSNGSVQQDTYPVQLIDLRNIGANSAQSRGMGALSSLTVAGYGLFEKIETDKEAMWPQLVSDDPQQRRNALDLIAQNEPTVVATATSLAEHGQLQPIGVIKEKDGSYDVIYGMQRAVAMAYNWATDPTKSPRMVEAKIYPESYAKDELALKLRSRAENRVRKAESPIDTALFYRELKREFKLSDAQVAEREDCGTQHVKDLLSLLDPLIEDRRIAIHSGEMGVDPALKLLRRRKEGGTTTEKDATATSQRSRFPSVKTISNAYSSGIKPKKMSDDLWDFYKDEKVRKFIALSLGFKFKPYTEPKAKAVKAAAEANGTGKKKFSISRSLANKLLVCLGQTNAATWTDPQAAKKLEAITNIAEEGQKVEAKDAQNLLDKLLGAYSDGYTVNILPAKK